MGDVFGQRICSECGQPCFADSWKCQECATKPVLPAPAHPASDALTAYTEASQSLGQRDDDANPLDKSRDGGEVVAWVHATRGALVADKSMEEVRKQSGMWSPLVLDSDLDAVRAELKQQRIRAALAEASLETRTRHFRSCEIALHERDDKLAASQQQLEKEQAQSQHLAEAMSSKIDELLATEKECSYYKAQYTRAEQIRKEACEANVKAQAKMLWQEDALAAKEQECERLREAAIALLNAKTDGEEYTAIQNLQSALATGGRHD